ncbi:MAG: hypothetical protein EBR30_10155 [Cytophagia bacterium]|nr:hypothetical protein [Cytophagia bacterium]
MKFFFPLLVLTASLTHGYTQQKLDSLNHQTHMPDSALRVSLSRIDSVKNSFNREAGVIKEAYQKSIHRSDSIEHFLNLKIDSLNSSKLPTHRYQEKCDSIKQKKQQLAQRFNSKLDSLKRNTTAKLDSIPMPPELKGYVGEYTSKLENVGLDTDILPAIDIPGFSKLDISLPSLKDIGNGDALNLPTDLNLSGFDLPKADLKGIKNLNGQAGDLASQAKALSETNLSEVQTMAAKEAEQQVAKISGAAELTKQAESSRAN